METPMVSCYKTCRAMAVEVWAQNCMRGEGGPGQRWRIPQHSNLSLGHQPRPLILNPICNSHTGAWFLPDAYAGRNDYIRETIVQMVINYNAFMTREILPWREQDNPNIAWDSIKFDKTLIDMEPEQGIPRIRYCGEREPTQTTWFVGVSL